MAHNIDSIGSGSAKTVTAAAAAATNDRSRVKHSSDQICPKCYWRERSTTANQRRRTERMKKNASGGSKKRSCNRADLHNRKKLTLDCGELLLTFWGEEGVNHREWSKGYLFYYLHSGQRKTQEMFHLLLKSSQFSNFGWRSPPPADHLHCVGKTCKTQTPISNRNNNPKL